MCCCPNIEVTVFLSRYKTRGTNYLRELRADIVVYLLIWRQNMQNGDCSYIINLILPSVDLSWWLTNTAGCTAVWLRCRRRATSEALPVYDRSLIRLLFCLYVNQKVKQWSHIFTRFFLPSLRKFRIYSGLSMVRWCLVSLYFFLTYSVYWNVSIDVELINNKTECERYLFFLEKQEEFSFELSISALRLDFRPVRWIYTGITGISWRKRRFPSY